MSRKPVLTLVGLLLAAALASGGPTAYADDGALGRSGETVIPLTDQEIRMADEAVILTVEGSRTRADLTFTFTNDGPARTVLMGFPVQGSRSELGGDTELHDFKTWVDGESVAVQSETGGPPAGSTETEYPTWMTWSVSFAAGQTRVVRNTYWGRNSYWSNGDVHTGYILKTGAAWKGPIGHAVIRLRADFLPTDPFRIYPADYRWEGNDLVWEWRDFEPRADVEVLWSTRPNAPPEQWETIMAAIEKGVPGGAAAFLKEYRRAHPNTAAPDAVDLYLALWLHQSHDEAAAGDLVRRALEAGVQHSLVSYLAVLEGLRQPAEVLEQTTNVPLRRWLQDRAGLKGEPPDLPVITFPERPAPTIPWINVSLADPDGDLNDWGVRVWLEPNEGLTPIIDVRADPSDPGSFTRPDLMLYPKGWLMSDWVWARAWAEDGRGHRRETGLVKLAVPAGAKLASRPPDPADLPQPVTPTPAPQPEPGQNPVPGLPLMAAGALLVLVFVVLRRVGRHCGTHRLR